MRGTVSERRSQERRGTPPVGRIVQEVVVVELCVMVRLVTVEKRARAQ